VATAADVAVVLHCYRSLRVRRALIVRYLEIINKLHPGWLGRLRISSDALSSYSDDPDGTVPQPLILAARVPSEEQRQDASTVIQQALDLTMGPGSGLGATVPTAGLPAPSSPTSAARTSPPVVSRPSTAAAPLQPPGSSNASVGVTAAPAVPAAPSWTSLSDTNMEGEVVCVGSLAEVEDMNHGPARLGLSLRTSLNRPASPSGTPSASPGVATVLAPVTSSSSTAPANVSPASQTTASSGVVTSVTSSSSTAPTNVSIASQSTASTPVTGSNSSTITSLTTSAVPHISVGVGNNATPLAGPSLPSGAAVGVTTTSVTLTTSGSGPAPSFAVGITRGTRIVRDWHADTWYQGLLWSLAVLFPTGTGGPLKGVVSLGEWARHILLFYDCRADSNPQFIPAVFRAMQRTQEMSATSVYLKQNNGVEGAVRDVNGLLRALKVAEDTRVPPPAGSDAAIFFTK
jgi:hypothetical protein